MLEKKSISSKVLLSVIIPTRNRSAYLVNLLDSLAEQDNVLFEWEVLVIDNASTDETKLIVEEKIKSLNIDINYFYEKELGLHRGRHRGAKEANGKYVAYLDDDMLISDNWLRSAGEYLIKSKVKAFCGKILPKWEAKPEEWLLKVCTNRTFGLLTLLNLGEKISPIAPGNVFGGNCFIEKKLIFELGGFNPDGMPSDLKFFRGDGESGFFEKFANAGYKAFYFPKAMAYHIIPKNRMTEKYLCKRAYLQGFSHSFSTIRRDHGLIKNDSFSLEFRKKYIMKFLEDFSQTNHEIILFGAGKHTEKFIELIKNNENLKNCIIFDDNNKLKKLDDIDIIKPTNNHLIKNIILSSDVRTMQTAMLARCQEVWGNDINTINIYEGTNLLYDSSGNLPSELAMKLTKAEQKGFEEHQNAVNNDPKLLKWVLKKDYF